jgi:hypothetical protein
MGLEPIARWIYTKTLSNERDPPGPAILLRRLIGNDRIRFVDGRSTITRDARGFQVSIERGLEPETLCLRFGCATATIGLLNDAALRTAAGLHDVRMVALAVIMQRAALRRALNCVGPRADEIGRIFVVTRQVAAERMRSVGLALASGKFRRVLSDVG